MGQVNELPYRLTWVALSVITALVMKNRHSCSSADVVRNLGSIWNARDMNKDTKVTIHHSLVQSIMLYNMLKIGH